MEKQTHILVKTSLPRCLLVTCRRSWQWRH